MENISYEKYKDIFDSVIKENKNIKEERLAKLTWGNVSELDEERKYIFIKPSGFPVEKLTWEDIPVIDLKTGKQVFSKRRASIDLDIHREIYLKNEDVFGIVHTHSTYATSFAQARVDISISGTTHADTFPFPIRVANQVEQFDNFEKNSGKRINELIDEIGEPAIKIGAVLLPGHGPFVFGLSASDAFKKSLILEEVSKIHYISQNIKKNSLEKEIIKVHYDRKHNHNHKGKKYGQ